MKTRLPIGLYVVAILQVIAPLVLPPAILRNISPVIWALVVLLFGLLGFGLLRRQSWSRVASIFLQGFNIIVRLLVVIAHAVVGGELGGAADMPLLISMLISVVLSALILYYVDLPDIQIIMQ